MAAAPSPVEVRDPLVRDTLKRAAVWLGLASAIFLFWKLSAAILLIVGGLVFAALFDGGSRLIGRVWPGPRWIRLTIVILLLLGGIVGFFALAGYQLAGQASVLTDTLQAQIARLSVVLREYGLGDMLGSRDGPLARLANELVGSFGKLTSAVGTAVGAIGSLVLMIVLGAFVAGDPRLYERGVEWLTPQSARPAMLDLLGRLASTLRRWTAGRLLAMAADGLLTTIGLLIAGVPLAGLLGLITGVLAFIPNIGAFIAGVLIVLVGFSVDTTTGLAALAVYIVVQFVEGNLLTPFVEKRVVDLAPALTLAAQLLFGVLFGLLGVALANPVMAMVKVALEFGRGAPKPLPWGWTDSPTLKQPG
jgi:predicted PurR-regulated permease PerM